MTDWRWRQPVAFPEWPRRRFLLGLAGLGCLLARPVSSQDRVEDLARWLCGGESVKVDEESRRELESLLVRFPGSQWEHLNAFLGTHGDLEVLARQALHRLLSDDHAWSWVPYASRPGVPPHRRQAWDQPCG